MNKENEFDGCWLCIITPVVILLIIILFLLQYNRIFNYYIKMTALYMTIMFTAFLCCFICTPIHFFGDPSKMVFNIFWICTRWIGIDCEIRNSHLFDTTSHPYIIIANHQSSVDIVVLSYLWPPNCTIMMKKSLRWIPFFNYAAYLANSIFVDRFNREKAMHSLNECVDRILNKKLNVFIFPEGTRNREGGLLPFKKGAFNIAVQASIPIIPIVISSYKQFYDKESYYFASNGYVIVEIMNPISTKGLTLDDVPKLTEEIREKMMETYERISNEAASHPFNDHLKQKTN